MVSQHFFLRINSHGSKSTLRTHARSGGWVAVCGCERASAVHPVSKHHPYTASVSPCQPYPAHPDSWHSNNIKTSSVHEIGRNGRDEPSFCCSSFLPVGLVFGCSTWLGDRCGEGRGDCWSQGSLVAMQVQKFKFSNRVLSNIFPKCMNFLSGNGRGGISKRGGELWQLLSDWLWCNFLNRKISSFLEKQQKNKITFFCNWHYS